jgi:hypothetical protein
MLHEDEIRLRHMLDHAREAVAMIAGKERADRFKGSKLRFALSHQCGKNGSQTSPSAMIRGLWLE